MSIFVLASFTSALLGWLMGFLSVLLILLVLVQRGKGGGLAGALGGPGGQSAFGSKAGDTFTLITIVMASIWGFTCAFTMWLLGQHAPPVADYDTTSMTAGPGEGLDDDVVTPEASGLGGASGLSGIGSLEENTGTPSANVDLVPADAPAAESSTESSEEEPAETESE